MEMKGLSDRPLTRPPQSSYIPTEEAFLQLNVHIREPIEWLTSWRDSLVTAPHQAVSGALVNTSALLMLAFGLYEQQDQRKYDRGSLDRIQFEHNQVVAMRTRCRSAAYVISSEDSSPVFPDLRSQTDEYEDLRIQDASINTFITNLNGSIPELHFFDVPDYLSKNASIGSVIAIPLSTTGTNTSNATMGLYGCLSRVDYPGSAITTNQDRQVNMDQVWPMYVQPGVLPKRIGTSFANYTNVPISSGSRLVFDLMATAGGLVNQSITQGLSEWTEGHVETILNLMLTNGSIRTAPEARPLMTLKNPGTTWWSEFFSQTSKTFNIPEGQTVFVAPDKGDWWYADMKVDSFGYAYSDSKKTIRYSMMSLFLYSGIACVFIIWSVSRGITSSSWESTSDLLALALRSPPPRDHLMPTSVLEDSEALAIRYGILADGEAAQLQPVEGKIPDEKRVHPNKLYR